MWPVDNGTPIFKGRGIQWVAMAGNGLSVPLRNRGWSVRFKSHLRAKSIAHSAVDKFKTLEQLRPVRGRQ